VIRGGEVGVVGRGQERGGKDGDWRAEGKRSGGGNSGLEKVVCCGRGGSWGGGGG
jgi:hypothetical protein